LLYGFKTSNITEARYKAFMHRSGGEGKELMARIKKMIYIFSSLLLLCHNVTRHFSTTSKEHSK